MLDERAALRAAAALDIDDVFHVAADLLERFAERFVRVRLAQQPIEPRQVDVHYRHSGTSFERVEARPIQLANVRQAEPQHGQPLDAEAPRQHREFAAQRQRHFGPEDAGPAHFEPLAARFHVHDHIDARLGVRVKRRLELHAAEAHLRIELLQRAHQRREVGLFVDDDAVDLVEHGQVLEADRFVAVGPADAEEFAGRIRVGGQRANRGGRGVRAEHDLLRPLGAPRVAPAFAAGFPAVFVRAADRLDDFRIRQRRVGRVAHVERILHVAGRVILRLKQRIEIPERRLDHRRHDFGEAHFQERPPRLLDDLAERMNLGGVDVLGRELDVVRPKLDLAPGAGFEVFGGEGVALFDDLRTRADSSASAPSSVSDSVRVGSLFDLCEFRAIVSNVELAHALRIIVEFKFVEKTAASGIRSHSSNALVTSVLSMRFSCLRRSERSLCPVASFARSIQPRAVPHLNTSLTATPFDLRPRDEVSHRHLAARCR